MTCPICDQKAANCDCTKLEKRLTEEAQDFKEYHDTLHAAYDRGKRDGGAIALEIAKLVDTTHYSCEDSWYTCPLHPEGCANDADTECNCGALTRKAKLDELLKRLGE